MRNRTVTYSADLAFHALADPSRRAMLDLLRQGSLAAGAIARSFPISRPGVSKHLRLLRRAGLVEERRRGRHRFYHLNPRPLQGVDRWLDQYRVFWTGKLERLKAFLEAGEEAGRQSSSKKNRRM
jgi:DNA-binding transcriptional ArsR family regulator